MFAKNFFQILDFTMKLWKLPMSSLNFFLWGLCNMIDLDEDIEDCHREPLIFEGEISVIFNI